MRTVFPICLCCGLLLAASLRAAPPVPLLYYDFSEGAGTAITNKGSMGGLGVLLGTAGDERWVTGPQGGALLFDGEDAPAGDRIATGLTAANLGLTGSTYTAAAWLQFTKTPGDNMVFGQVSASSGVLHLGVRNGRSHLGHWANDITGGTPLSTGVWYHVVWEYREGYQRIFLDGNLDAGPLARGSLAATTEIVIGRSGPANWGFQGRLDEVVVFNQALNLAQIRHLAAGGSPLALPTNEVSNNPTFHTAPFGPGGTWNLYQLRGTLADRPRTWADAQVQAAATIDPSGLTTSTGHLADVTQRQENFFIERMAAFSNVWIGLTDNEAFGGSEAGTSRTNGWRWTSGAAYSYQNWNTGEPSNSGTSGEDGVHLNANSGQWNDLLDGLAPQNTNPPAYLHVVEWPTASPIPVPGAQVMAPILPTPLAGRGPANAAFGVRVVSNNGTVDNIVRAVAALQGGLGTIVEGRVMTINATDPEAPGSVGAIPGDVAFVGNTPADDNGMVHIYKGRVVVTNTGMYTFVLRSDDGGAVRFPGRVWTTVYTGGVIDIRSPDTLYRERGPGELRGVVELSNGQYDVEVLAYENTGVASHEFYAAPGAWAKDANSPAWRLVGQRSRGVLALPGLTTVNGTSWLVRVSAPGGNAVLTNITNLAQAEQELAVDPGVVQEGWAYLDFVDPQDPGSPTGSYPNNHPFPNGTGAADNDFALEATGTLEIPATGLYQFGFRGDDGASLQIVGQSWSNLIVTSGASSVITGDTVRFDAATADSHTIATIQLAAGTYPIRVVYWERAGGAHFEVFGDSSLNIYPDLLRGGGGRLIEDPPGLALSVIEPVVVDAFTPRQFGVGGLVSLTWNSMANAEYRIEGTEHHTAWTTVLNGVATQGSNTTVQFVSPFASPSASFRVVEQ